MVFTLAIVFASTRQAATPVHGNGLLIGAALGLAVALTIAYAIFKLGRRLNLGVFFRVIGIVLMVFAAGLLADAVENMQQLGWLPFLGRPLWDSSRFLSESSSLGDVFHSLLGYADHPTVLQAVVWLVYVVTATTAFIVLGRRRRRQTVEGARRSPRPRRRRRWRPGRTPRPPHPSDRRRREPGDSAVRAELAIWAGVAGVRSDVGEASGAVGAAVTSVQVRGRRPTTPARRPPPSR